MTGGLMNLVAYGSENLLFNGNPKKTFFKATYQKYTNFGLQRFRIDYEGTKILNEIIPEFESFAAEKRSLETDSSPAAIVFTILESGYM